MNKQLIYTDITKVLYMMKNHDIRFLIYAKEHGLDLEFEFDFNTENFDMTHVIESAIKGIYEYEFRVHPDDVAKFEGMKGDKAIGQFSYYTSYGDRYPSTGHGLFTVRKQEEVEPHYETQIIERILERDGKVWLAPDEVRDE